MNQPNPNALAVREDKLQPAGEFNVFGNIANFENAQRMAKALASSSIVPETYRGEGRLGDCLIALEISNRIGANVLAVMQNLYVVHGKPGWSSQFLISCVNASRRFTPLRYQMTGTKGGDDYGCIAWAMDRTGERLESPEVTLAIARAEGWIQKAGSKWKTMPELMLHYRAATFFTRLYAPELTMGIVTRDELDDMIDVEASPVASPGLPDFTPPPAAPVPARRKHVKREAALEAAPEAAAEAAPEAAAPGEPAGGPENVTVPPEARPPARRFSELEKAILKAEVTADQVLWYYNNEVRREGQPEVDVVDGLPAGIAAALTRNLLANNEVAAAIRATEDRLL